MPTYQHPFPDVRVPELPIDPPEDDGWGHCYGCQELIELDESPISQKWDERVCQDCFNEENDS